MAGFSFHSWDEESLLVPTLCRADLGWIFYFVPPNFRKIAGEFLSEFWWRILIANLLALFFQGFRPPKKFTPKIHVQNCRHSSPISLSWTRNLFTAIFCLRGRPKFTQKVHVLFSPPSGCQSIPAFLTTSNWSKLIKVDWSWLELTETDWKRQKIDRNGLKVDENLGATHWHHRKLASAISHGRWDAKNT